MTCESLFTDGRTFGAFTAQPVEAATLHRIYETMKWGPTSYNCGPARIVFVNSPAAKELLIGCLAPPNVGKVRQAPVTAIVGMDMAFVDTLPTLSPHFDARALFDGKPDFIASTAQRNSSLQAAYLIIAARMAGLSCGPMSGFDAAKVDAAFWSGTQVRTNLLCNLGYGDADKLRPRAPRLAFDDVCRFA